MFKECKVFVIFESCSVRTSTSKDHQHLDQIRKLLLNDCRLTINGIIENFLCNLIPVEQLNSTREEILHHFNELSHSAIIFREYLTKNSKNTALQVPYSSDMV